MSKKILPSNFTALWIIASTMRHGRSHSPNELIAHTGFSKQKLNYWLDKFCEEGILHKYSRGIYDMTPCGKRIIDQYKRLQGKQLVRIENMHVTYKVIGDVDKLFSRLTWKRGGLKHTRIYTSEIENHTVRLIQKKDGYNLQVYVTKVLGETPRDAYFHARLEADEMALKAQWWGAKLSQGWVSSEPEIAIPSPVASALLMTSEASQIKTSKGIMNRSKGRYADWEPTSLQQAQKIVDMPDAITRLEEKTDYMAEQLEKLTKQLCPNTSLSISDFEIVSTWDSFSG